MQSVKLSVTCRSALKKKFDAAALRRIDGAVRTWIAADKARGIRTVHVAVDDPADLKPFAVPAVKGRVTAARAKEVLDRLVARLSPDYIVLFGGPDVIPHFVVENPSAHGDDEPTVPTDNPYACSAAFRAKDRKSYLVPDRVVGRIPDLTGSGDDGWLVDYLTGAAAAAPNEPRTYAKDFLVCCDQWKASGDDCVRYIGRAATSLLISPPEDVGTKRVLAGHGTLLQMIKCHGGRVDSQFYGQKGGSYPPVLRSQNILKRTKARTVVGAMCCYGASLFDPTDPAAVTPGDVPIANVYLKQGAYGFLGATTTAWVGQDAMLDADWIVGRFLKGVLSGASLGRATLESKQEFMRWSQQQGEVLDGPDEKTLLHFVLLGDPSIHPVQSRPTAATPAAAKRGVGPVAAMVMGRRQRRAASHRLGVALREDVPERTDSRGQAPAHVRTIAQQLARDAGTGYRFQFSAPRVETVRSRIEQPELVAGAASRRALARIGAPAAPVLSGQRQQYYWVARRKGVQNRRGELRHTQYRVVSVQTAPDGTVLRSHVLASC